MLAILKTTRVNIEYNTVARKCEFYIRVARTILFLPREHKIHILELVFLLLCRYTDEGVFGDVTKIFDHFKISRDYQMLSKTCPKVT